ncbi:MAG TPA: outer membrane lipoprotein carrier protein LolA [Steroidobacteraceae bacterium]|jgi:outer membrane lipoprotein carrier protein|nr:outer membrane lipoprotein carrier protein LolA [Steroidobacteraceae bacterium]
MRGLPQRQSLPRQRLDGWVLWLSLVAFIGLCSPSTAPARPHAQAASAQSGTALDRYLAGLTTLRTDFTQSVTDATGKSAAGGSGSLIVQRPDRFRWDYQPASEKGADSAAPQGSAVAQDRAAAEGSAGEQGQLLVADGSNLWFYDRELAQVTVKPIDTALSATPIMLLSGSSAALRTQFDITAEPSAQGLQWVQVRPRGSSADFSEARLGFRGDELARMIVHNMLGQTVQLDFSHSRRNAPVDAGLFDFKVPQGVDVIGKPLPASGS